MVTHLDRRLRSPAPGARTDRTVAALHGIARWVSQPGTTQLLDLFGRPSPACWSRWLAHDVFHHLDRLEPWDQPCSLWDFRGLARRNGHRTDDGAMLGGAARLHSWPSVLGSDGDDRIVALAHDLQLACGSDAMEQRYDIVVSLGGLRLSPKVRTEWAVHQLTARGVRAGAVVLLGTHRPVQPEERSATDTYAPSAIDEMDLLAQSGTGAGLIDSTERPVASRVSAPGPPLDRWSVRTFRSPMGVDVYLVAAPGRPSLGRRADTASALRFLMDQPEAAGACRLLLVTSAAHLPYQQVEALRVLGLPLGAQVETIAVPPDMTAHLPATHQPHQYLQEVRSTFQAALRLWREADAAD